MREKLPVTFLEYWPEVFNHVRLKTVPLEYLSEVTLFFNNGKIWNIELLSADRQKIKETFADLFRTYKRDIIKVDVKFDAESLKKDIINQTKLFLDSI